jgi:hypothetical protein
MLTIITLATAKTMVGKGAEMGADTLISDAPQVTGGVSVLHGL